MQFEASLNLEQGRTAPCPGVRTHQLLLFLQRESLHICTSLQTLLSQLCYFLWCSTMPREAVKMWDAADVWVRRETTWGTGFVAGCREQQTANLAKWSRFCLLCAGQSRFSAAGAIAQKGVKMGEVIVPAMWNNSRAASFSKSFFSAAVVACLWSPIFWRIKLTFS